MFRRNWILIAALCAGVALYAGGFFLTVHSHGDGFLVRAEGCQDYSQAKVTGRAEGLVNGKRQSIVLNLTPGERPGVYVVQKQWPATGKWVLVFSGSSGARVTHTILEIRPDGKLEPRMSMRPVDTAEIEAALANSGA